VRPVELVALLLVAALLLSMPVFALVGRGRAVDVDVARRPTTILLGLWIRDWLMWIIAPMERAFVRANASPDVFNYLGVVFGAAAGFAFAFRELALGGWMVLLGGASDIFDGRIARARGITSERGAFLDSTLDRFAETFAFVGLAVFYDGVPWVTAAVALALGASLLVSYTRARGEALGIQCRGGVMQRAERLVLLALASIADPPITARAGWPVGTVLSWAVATIAIGALGTAVYRTTVIARGLGER
jgi:CDP-diacylglycerol--glycerol-3-phosphate 3-phosphatidyltransferase